MICPNFADKQYFATQYQRTHYQRIAKVSSHEILTWILNIGCKEVEKCLPRPNGQFDDTMKTFMEYYHKENPYPSCSVLPNGYDWDLKCSILLLRLQSRCCYRNTWDQSPSTMGGKTYGIILEVLFINEILGNNAQTLQGHHPISLWQVAPSCVGKILNLVYSKAFEILALKIKIHKELL